MARISKLKWHTASSGSYEAPTDFSLLVAQNSSRNKNIAIVEMLDVDNKASKMVDSVVAGTFFVDLSSPAKMLEMSPGECMFPKRRAIHLGVHSSQKSTVFFMLTTC